MFIGFGTVVNVATIILGAGIGMALGHRLPERTRDTVTDSLGLVTLLIGELTTMDVTSAALSDRVGTSAPILIVLGSLLIGGIVGSLVELEQRLEGLGAGMRTMLVRKEAMGDTGSDSAAPAGTGGSHLSAR